MVQLIFNQQQGTKDTFNHRITITSESIRANLL